MFYLFLQVVLQYLCQFLVIIKYIFISNSYKLNKSMKRAKNDK